MTETFHMTRSMRIGSTVLTALLLAGLPLGSLTLLSVRGRKSGKIYTPRSRWWNRMARAFWESGYLLHFHLRHDPSTNVFY